MSTTLDEHRQERRRPEDQQRPGRGAPALEDEDHGHPADGMTLDWGVLHDVVDPWSGTVAPGEVWGLGSEHHARALAEAIEAGTDEGRSPRTVRRNARVAHRWVSHAATGDAPERPAHWDLIETLVLQVARATGMPENAVRLGLGLPLPDAS